MAPLQRFMLAIVGVLAFHCLPANGQTFLNSFGTTGSGAGQFNSPSGLVYDSANSILYVADTGNNRVEFFDSGGHTDVFGFGLSSPQSLSSDAAGDVYVADQANNRIVEFASVTQGGYLIQSLGSAGIGVGQLNLPSGVAVDPSAGGGIYVGDTSNNRVDVYSSAGAYVRPVGSAGSGNGQLSAPHGLAVNSTTGDIYVADFGNNRIEEFSDIGNFVRAFGNPGLNAPSSVALNSANSLLYVADQDDSRIAVFSTSGSLVTTFGSPGAGNGQFSVPTGVTVTPAGIVYIADTGNDRIERWFDAASWTAGTNTFTNAATGPTSVAAGPNQILGASLTLNASKGLVVGDTTTVNTGGTVTLSGGTLSTANLNIVGGQVIDTSGILTTSTLYVSSSGLLQIGNATVTANAPPLDGPAVYNSAGGEIRLTNATHAILSATSVTNYGLIDGSGSILGAFNNFGGTVQAASGQTLTVASAATSGGAISFASGGTLNFGSGLTLQSGSTVQFALAGLTSGTQYGQLDVTGALGVTGALNVTFAGNYDPHDGEQFHLLNFSSESGMFSSVTLPALDPGLHWDTSLLYSQGVVRVSIPGDVNSDGTVNGLDINQIATHWLQAGNPASLSGDANGDGIVNGLDINIIASHWLQSYGAGSGSGSAVPEPSTIILAAFGGLAMLIFRTHARRA